MLPFLYIPIQLFLPNTNNFPPSTQLHSYKSSSQSPPIYLISPPNILLHSHLILSITSISITPNLSKFSHTFYTHYLSNLIILLFHTSSLTYSLPLLPTFLLTFHTKIHTLINPPSFKHLQHPQIFTLPSLNSIKLNQPHHYNPLNFFHSTKPSPFTHNTLLNIQLQLIPHQQHLQLPLPNTPPYNHPF